MGGNCSFKVNLATTASRVNFCHGCCRPAGLLVVVLQLQNAKTGGTVRWRRAMTEEFDEDVVFEVRCERRSLEVDATLLADALSFLPSFVVC